MYDKIVYEKYKAMEESKPSQNFAPSSFRCDRLSFFRLRGVDPDEVVDVNVGLDFAAMLGTACHLEIQSNLKNSIGDQWVDVEEYLKVKNISHPYEIVRKTEFETNIQFLNPPVKFSCDGIIKLNEKYYLLEIKTSEHQSFKTLREPKSQHIDQIKCYCSLLELNDAIVLYQDRLYGETKCYELHVADYEMRDIFARMENVMEYVKKNIAPPRLDNTDYWCVYCKYTKRCKQWG